MQIAHITLLHGYNYGGLLQAYATQQILRAAGHEVLTLDYHPSKWMILLRKLTFNIPILHRSLGFLLDRMRFSGAKEFNAFRKKHFRFSASCHSPAQLSAACRGYNAVVVGSDQVWSPIWLRAPYFLDFDLEPGCKRFSLAACCGVISEDPSYLAYVAKTIARFDAISVRNDFTAELVSRTTGRSATIICDPTLAVDIPTEPVPGISGPYILVYLINRSESLSMATAAIRHLKAVTGLPVFSIPPAELKGANQLGADRCISDISPSQWTHLVANASYLITDSFHGSMFAAKHHRNFVVPDSGHKVLGRIHSLLSKLQLEHFFLYDSSQLPVMDTLYPTTDWSAVDSRISDMRDNYLAFVASLDKV